MFLPVLVSAVIKIGFTNNLILKFPFVLIMSKILNLLPLALTDFALNAGILLQMACTAGIVLLFLIFATTAKMNPTI